MNETLELILWMLSFLLGICIIECLDRIIKKKGGEDE